MGKDLRNKELGQGFRQRNDGMYEGRFTMNGKSYSVYAETFKECREKYETSKQLVKNGSYIDNKKITIQKYYETDYKLIKEKKCKQSTLKSKYGMYDCHIKGTVLANTKMQMVDRRMVRAFINELEKESSSVVAKCVLGILSDIFNCALDDGIVNTNPCARMKIKTESTVTNEKDGTHRALTFEEIEKLQNALADTWYANFFDFLIYTGCRISEARALTWSDVDFEKGTISINKTVALNLDGEEIIQSPKTEKSKRNIAMLPQCRDALAKQKQMAREYLSARGKLTNLVFPSINGTYLNEAGVNHQFQRTCAKLNIPRITAHCTRHTYTTLMIADGTSTSTVSMSLGHSSTAMTEKYTHIREETVNADILKHANAFKKAQ